MAFRHTPAGGTTDIWICELDQGTFSRLTFEGFNREPFWSPNGSEVGFSSDRDGDLALYARPADFSGEARLLVSGEGEGLFDAAWTLDESVLVYRRGLNSATADLAYAAPDSGTPTVFLGTAFEEAVPSLSPPDGRWLAYQSDESDQREVYVRPFPGPGGRDQISTDGGENPIWAHNGREIFYLASGSLWVAEIRTDPDFAVGPRVELSSFGSYSDGNGTPNFDLSADDERLLAMRTTTFDQVSEDVLVQNLGLPYSVHRSAS